MSKSSRAGMLALTIIILQLFGSLFLGSVLDSFSDNAYSMLMYLLVYIIPGIIIGTSLYINQYIPPAKSFFIKPLEFKTMLLICAITVLLMPFTAFLSYIASLFFPNVAAAALDSGANSSPLYLNILSMAVFPAFCEELIFRGIIFNKYLELSPQKAVLASGLIFGIAHFNMQQFLYAFIIGMVFALFVYITKSIFSSIVPHFIINASQIIMITLAKHLSGELSNTTLNPSESTSLEAMVTPFSPQMFLVLLIWSILFLIPAIILIKRLIKNHREKNIQKIENQETKYIKEPTSVNDEPSYTKEHSLSVYAEEKLFSPPLITIIILFIAVNILVYI